MLGGFGDIIKLQSDEEFDDNVFSLIISLINKYKSFDEVVNPSTKLTFMQNIIYIANEYFEKYNNKIQFIYKLFPIFSQWYIDLNKENTLDCYYVLDNICSLFLSVIELNDELNEDILLKGIERFPPIDETETEPMGLKMINIFYKFQDIFASRIDLSINFCIAISKLIILTNSQIKKSQITSETFTKIITIFKILMKNNEIQSTIEQIFKEQINRIKKILEQ